ncbi:uncharacterized protein LOC105835573 isoform X2 [Monomorium pharaonis]|nr:uncharacterized protein LOC105835573 isoform X2 [Monomorium pharaonis]
MFFCKYCNEEIESIENSPQHACFINKDIYLENNNILCTIEENKDLPCAMQHNSTEGTENIVVKEGEKKTLSNSPTIKQHAVWTKNATLALLALYEMKLDMLDSPKTRGKIWQEIANGLLEYSIEMTSDQVRWKINALLKKYKEVIDNYSKSGRGNIEFEWFQVMDDIFGKKKDATNQNYTVSNKILNTKIEEPSTSQQLEKKRFFESSHLSSTNQLLKKKSSNKSLNKLRAEDSADISPPVNVTDTDLKQKNRPTHGTCSNIAKTKIELEKQWFEHLAIKKDRDRLKDEKYSTLIESKKEVVKLKRKQFALKEEELQQRREIAENKLREKKRLHDGMLEIEKQKLKILKKYLDKENVQNMSSESD